MEKSEPSDNTGNRVNNTDVLNHLAVPQITKYKVTRWLNNSVPKYMEMRILHPSRNLYIICL
jgi:hypothetical protein